MADPTSLRGERYAVIRVLGEGGQGTTLEAVDKRRGNLVAIKRFTVRGAKSWKEVELAEREATVLAAISHPALPRYVEHFEEGGQLYLVTEKIEGESLAEIKKRGDAFTEAEIVRLLGAAADALEYLHGRSPPIVHRDIKPSNVIRRPDGSFAFIDFGAVRHRLKPEGGSTVVGTFGYMAPEQFQGRAMPGSDVYAVGATALSLLTGREPEDLPHRGLAIDVRAALARTRTSTELTTVLAAILEPDPDRRPDRLAPLLVGLRSASSSRDERPPKGSRKHQRRRDREAQRSAKKKDRAARRSARPAGGIPAILVSFAVIALTVAQIALVLSLRVFVPVLLTVLSIVFGKSLRVAAGRVSDAGKRGVAAVVRGRHRVRDAADHGIKVAVRSPGTDAPQGARVRVARPPRDEDVHARLDDDPDAADDEHDDSGRAEARRRSRA